MNNFFKKIFFYSFLLSSLYLILYTVSLAAAPQELRDNIDKKTQELLDVTDKIKETQKNLEATQEQSRTLESEIKKIDKNVEQVNLSIRSSEIIVSKLGLEIDSLQYDITDAENDIIAKREAIVEILKKLQQNDGETPLIIFLKNKTLSESVSELQNLANLNGGLSTEIESLKNTKIILADKMQETADKKQATETENLNLKNKQVILSETKKERQTILTQTKGQEKIYQSSLTELEKKQAAIAAEIEDMDEELRLKIDPSALPTKRPGVLAWPVSGPLTQGYGATKFAIYGYRGKWHNGIDLGVPIGTPIVAAEKGTVVATGNTDNYCYRGAYGKFIVIEHENNLTTLYAHLSLPIVKKGDIVARGQLIGYSGKTGYATGPHLHFTVYASLTFRMGASNSCGLIPYGGDINPLDYL
jgi:murein DD-endopeptidase MepM/ murein hydrolase activator NlpD